MNQTKQSMQLNTYKYLKTCLKLRVNLTWFSFYLNCLDTCIIHERNVSRSPSNSQLQYTVIAHSKGRKRRAILKLFLTTLYSEIFLTASITNLLITLTRKIILTYLSHFARILFICLKCTIRCLCCGSH